MAGTHEEATLLMRVAQYATGVGFQEGTKAIFAEHFNPEAVDARDPHIYPILTVGEMLGTFVKNDLLSRELVLDLFWVSGLWARVGPAALKAREGAGEPRLFENFEALAAERFPGVARVNERGIASISAACSGIVA